MLSFGFGKETTLLRIVGDNPGLLYSTATRWLLSPGLGCDICWLSPGLGCNLPRPLLHGEVVVEVAGAGTTTRRTAPGLGQRICIIGKIIIVHCVGVDHGNSVIFYRSERSRI